VRLCSRAQALSLCVLCRGRVHSTFVLFATSSLGNGLPAPPCQTTRTPSVLLAFVWFEVGLLALPYRTTRRRWAPYTSVSFDTSAMGSLCLRVVHNGSWVPCDSVCLTRGRSACLLLAWFAMWRWHLFASVSLETAALGSQ
jgi:hypothetical protein